MRLLAGPYVVVVAVLALGGALKLLRPVALADAMGDLRLPRSTALVRTIGCVEVLVAAAALLLDRRAFATVVAASYLVFAAFVAATLRDSSVRRSCGCFGLSQAPSTLLHLTLDLAAVGVALAVAFDPGPGLAEVLRDQPLTGVPFVALAGVCTYLVFLAETALPQVLHPAATQRRQMR